MNKVKLLTDITRYNVSGFDKHTLTGKEGEVVEVSHFNMEILVKDGLAEEYSEEPEDDSEDTSENTDDTTENGKKTLGQGLKSFLGLDKSPDANSTPSDADPGTFELTEETILHIQKLTKDKIEAILRGYGIEADKRKKLLDLQEEMILTVGTTLPDDAVKSENTIEALVQFYADTFKIQLDAKSYDEKTLSKLTEDVSNIISAALQ